MSRLLSSVLKNCISPPIHIQVRYSGRMKKPFIPIVKKDVVPELYFSLRERLDEKDEKLKDPEKFAKINIGYAIPKISRDDVLDSREKRAYTRSLRNNEKLEKSARRVTLQLDLDTVEADWIKATKPSQITELAENYEIYKHLFGDFAYFYPIVHLNIFYDYDEDTASPVYYGNLLKPKEAAAIPRVEFESDSDSLWTLLLTNPDGNLLDNDSEMIHWFVGNIRGGDVAKGEELVSYMQPIPPKGSGFHRFCFVLYKQQERIDYSEFQKDKPCLRLSDRTFKTFDFYKKYQDVLTPAGLSWFQADYDVTLSHYFHHTLKMKEPTFEYEFPKPYLAPQQHFPHRKVFNRYMDLHRDPKDMQELMLKKRLKRVHPFKGELPLLPFPQAEPVPRNWPMWRKREIEKERDGQGKYRDMYRGDDRPYINERKRTVVFNNLKYS